MGCPVQKSDEGAAAVGVGGKVAGESGSDGKVMLDDIKGCGSDSAGLREI